MAELLKAEVIAPLFKRYLVRAPEIARKHRAGQFVIVLLHEHGERIPLTIADSNAREGTITLVVQEVGKSTMEMGLLAAGASIEVVGPLGEPTKIKSMECRCNRTVTTISHMSQQSIQMPPNILVWKEKLCSPQNPE